MQLVFCSICIPHRSSVVYRLLDSAHTQLRYTAAPGTSDRCIAACRLPVAAAFVPFRNSLKCVAAVTALGYCGITLYYICWCQLVEMLHGLAYSVLQCILTAAANEDVSVAVRAGWPQSSLQAIGRVPGEAGSGIDGLLSTIGC